MTRAEARTAGLPRYYTGKACIHGHDAYRQTTNGTCIVCGAGRTNTWRIANSEKISAKRFERYWADPVPVRSASLAWHYANHARSLEKGRAWKGSHREEVQAYRRAYYVANWKEAKFYQAAWSARNAYRNRIYAKNAKAKRRKVAGRYTVGQIRALIAKQRGKCAYFRICGNRLSRGYHTDHIQAIASGGTNWIRNIQLACPTCNRRKSAKDPVAFAQEIGLLI